MKAVPDQQITLLIAAGLTVYCRGEAIYHSTTLTSLRNP